MAKPKPRYSTADAKLAGTNPSSDKLRIQQARMEAASSFKEGDRVRYRQTQKAGKFIGINRGFAVTDVWVEFDTDSEIGAPISCNPLDLELITGCQEDTQCLAASVELVDCATEVSQKPDSNTSSKSPNLLKQIPTDEPCLPSTSLPFPVTTTSPLSGSTQDSLTSSLEEALAKELVLLTLVAKDSQIADPLCGLSNCGSSNNVAPASLSGKMLVAPDIQSQGSPTHHSEQYSGILPSAGMMQNGKLLPQPHLERPTAGNEYLLLPTPMAHSRASAEYSRPGQDKLEQKLRELGVTPPGHVSHPAVREYLMGLPDGWTNITEADGGDFPLCLEQLVPHIGVSPIERQESQPLETPVLQPKLPLHGEELQQSQIKESLSLEELEDRHRLELKVDRAFVEAGSALKEIRDRRLYRDAYPDFALYCRDRFEKTHRAVNYLIAAAETYENLAGTIGSRESECQTGTICSHENQNQTGTNCSHLLPTKESQIRDLAGLDPLDQREIWREAVEASGGKVPTARIVKEQVSRYRSKPEVITSTPIRARPGDVFQVRCKLREFKKYDGCWAIAVQVNEYTVSVNTHDRDLQMLPEHLQLIDSTSESSDIKIIHQRIKRIRECGLLDRVAYTVLESLGRQTFLTPLESEFLRVMEEKYGIVD